MFLTEHTWLSLFAETKMMHNVNIRHYRHYSINILIVNIAWKPVLKGLVNITQSLLSNHPQENEYKKMHFSFEASSKVLFLHFPSINNININKTLSMN